MRRKFWGALIALGIGGLYAGMRYLATYWDFYGASAELPQAVRDYRAAGLPWTAAEFDRHVAPGENAAPLLRQAIAAWPRKNAHGDPDEALGQAYQDGTVERRLPRYEKALRLAHEAARLPRLDFGWNLDLGPYLLMPESGPIKAIVRLLAARAESRAKRGDDAGALQDLGDARRLAGLIGQEPALVAVLVHSTCDRITDGAAQKCLAHASGDLPRLVRYRERLAAPSPTLPNVGRALRSEVYLRVALGRNLDRMGIGRSFWPQSDSFSLMEGAMDGPDELAGRGHPRSVPAMRRDGLPENVRARAYFARGLQMWTELARATNGLTDPTTGERSQAVENRYADAKGLSHGLDAILFPVFSQAWDTRLAVEASHGVTLAFADALILHARTGRWPTSTRVRDPFGGGTLRARFDGGRFRVWSVGHDRRDDGGLTSGETKPTAKRSDDVVAAYPPILRKAVRAAPPTPLLNSD